MITALIQIYRNVFTCIHITICELQLSDDAISTQNIAHCCLHAPFMSATVIQVNLLSIQFALTILGSLKNGVGLKRSYIDARFHYCALYSEYWQ